MSKRKGRKYERELADLFREKFDSDTVDTAANAGVAGQFDADLLVWPPDAEPLPGWERGDDPRMAQMEVKYRADGKGFAKLYEAHLESVGLGSMSRVVWADGYATGGIHAAMRHIIFRGLTDHRSEYWEDWEREDNALNGFLRRAFKPGVHVVACRMARRPWVFVWKEGRK